MLRSTNELKGYEIEAKDGTIGKVHEFLFDDTSWTFRYLVVNTGSWLSERLVLIPLLALDKPDWHTQSLPVALTKEQIEDSPSIDTDKPVSRQQETSLFAHYGLTAYWLVPAHMGMGAFGVPATVVRDIEEEENESAAKYDPHLRSTWVVTGYQIQATDGEIGHVEDFIFEDEVWHIRYLVVDTKDWLPAKKVIVTPTWIDKVDWDEKKVAVNLNRDEVKQSPEFDYDKPINREYEVRLYDSYGRPRYWES